MTFLIVAAGACALIACGASQAGDAARSNAMTKTLPYRVLETASIPDTGRGGAARGMLVRSKAKAARTLRAWGLERGLAAATALDYSRRSLVVVLAGSASDSAYRLRVRRLTLRERRIEVRADLLRPQGAIGAMSIIRPYVLLSVARGAVTRAGPSATVRVSAG